MSFATIFDPCHYGRTALECLEMTYFLKKKSSLFLIIANVTNKPNVL